MEILEQGNYSLYIYVFKTLIEQWKIYGIITLLLWSRSFLLQSVNSLVIDVLYIINKQRMIVISCGLI